jgi:site-specific recombinase XerD
VHSLRTHEKSRLASALAYAGTALYEIGAVLGHRQLSTTTRYAHHSPQRMVETTTAAARAGNLLPAPEEVED